MLLKEWLSFSGLIAGVEIYRTEDEYGEITVLEYRGERVLTFDTMYEQSRVAVPATYLLIHDYTQAMLLALIFTKPTHVTLLGLGGGSLASCIYYFYPDITLQAVELRQAVIDIAYTYFRLPHSERLRVINEDAHRYLLKSSPTSTDIIFSDLYYAYEMSPLQRQEDFIKLCWCALTAEGWLVINYHRPPSTNIQLMECVKSIFPNVYTCTVSGDNTILFCGKSSKRINKSSLKQQMKQTSNLIGKPFEKYLRLLQLFK